MRARCPRWAPILIWIWACLTGACGSSEVGLGVPPVGGNGVEPLTDGELTTRRMVRRAAGEFDAGRPDVAELWVRRALAADPEDTGGLAVLARIFAAKGDLDGARDVYRIAAMGGPPGEAAVRRERAALLLRLAKAELEAGRVFRVAFIARELDAVAPKDLGRERGELHRQLAETWIVRGLGPQAAEEAQLAEPHGVDLRGVAARIEHLAAPTPATLAKVGQALGWRKTSEWLYGIGRVEEAATAIAQALADDHDDGDAQLDAAFVALATDGAADAATHALAASKAGLEPQRVAAIAERLVSSGHASEARTVYRAVLARAPGLSDAAIAGANLALGDGDSADALAIATALGGARPDSWETALEGWRAHRELTIALIAAALQAGHLAHEAEARLALAVLLASTDRIGEALPQLDQVAGATGDDVALVSTLAETATALRNEGRTWLTRYASQHAGHWQEVVASAWLLPVSDPESLTPLTAFGAAHPEDAARVAYAKATLLMSRRRYSDARATLEQAVAQDASVPSDAYRALAEIALRLASLEPGADERAAGLLTTWLAGPAPSLPELSELTSLAEPTRFPTARAVLLRSWQKLAPERKGLASELASVLVASHQWDDARAAYEAAVRAVEGDRLSGPGANARALIAVIAESLRVAERPSDALAILARLHPAELERLDTLPELAARYEAGGEPIAADMIFDYLLAAADAGNYPSARTLALGDQLLELGRPERARRAYARAIEGGDRTSRAFFGWMRAIVRASGARAETAPGDDVPPANAEVGLDEVINRWFESRPQRDERAREDAANALRDEGALGRARQIYLDLVTNGIPDIGRWSTVCDLFRRMGDGAALAATVATSATKQRWATQGYGMLAEKLAAAGQQDAADGLLAARLATQRDLALVSSALQVAMLRGDGKRAEELARGLFQQGAANADVWERVLRDLASAGFSELALSLADTAVERFPRAVKLLVLRAGWLVGLGRFPQALADLAEVIGRAPASEDASPLVSAPLKDGLQTERLAALLARGLANQTTARSEPVLAYARALIDAGRSEDAEQELLKALGDSDRGQAAIAALWLDAREPARALAHAERGVAELPSDDSFGPLGGVAFALLDLGAPAARADVFVRLGIQAGATPMQVANVMLRLGRADELRGWLERALQTAPTPEAATALAHLRLAGGDPDGAIAAYERVVVGRVAEPLPSGRAAQLAGLALSTIVPELVQAGEARRAAALVTRMQARYGPGSWLRLLGAYAAVEVGDWSDALARLADPFEPWRGQRETFPTLLLLLQSLCAHGHASAAADFLARALESGSPERDLLAAAIRIGARAGRPELAWRSAARLHAQLPAATSWMAGEALAAARMPRSGRAMLENGYALAQAGPSIARAALALVLGAGAGLDELRTRPSRIHEDRAELAGATALVAFTLGRWSEAARALLPTLAEASADPTRAEVAVLAASLSADGALLDATVEALGRARGDRVALRLQLATRLATAGRWTDATRLFAPLSVTRRGFAATALPAIDAALAAGDDARAEDWGTTLTTASTDGGSDARAAVAQRWALFGRYDRAEALLDGVRDGTDKARVASLVAIGRAATDAAWTAIAREPLGTNASRAQRAEAILGSPDRGAARAALAVLDTGAEVSASQGVLELRAVAAWRAGDRALARTTLSELRKRFPGPLLRADRVVAAAVEAGDADGLDALFALPAAIAASTRQSLLAAAVLELDGAVDAGLAPTLARWALADGASPDAIALAETPADADALWAGIPWDANADAYRAWVLARRGQAERATALARAALQRLPEAGILDLDARPLGMPQAALAARALGEAELAQGHVDLALAAFDRSLVARLDGAVLGLRADALARGGRASEAQAAYRACAANGGMEAWARRCRAAVAPAR